MLPARQMGILRESEKKLTRESKRAVHSALNTLCYLPLNLHPGSSRYLLKSECARPHYLRLWRAQPPYVEEYSSTLLLCSGLVLLTYALSQMGHMASGLTRRHASERRGPPLTCRSLKPELGYGVSLAPPLTATERS